MIPLNNGGSITAAAISRHAKQLDNLTTEWFKAYIKSQKKPKAYPSKLANYVNELARQYGILAMSIGLINRETNKLNHHSHFPPSPGSQDIALPSYPEPTGNLFSTLAPHLCTYNKAAGPWIIELFSVRRKRQSINHADESPEGIDSPKPLVVGSRKILKTLRTWINLLTTADFAKRRFQEIDVIATPIRELKERLSDDISIRDYQEYEKSQSLYGCIDTLASNIEFTSKWPLSNISIFFCSGNDPNSVSQEERSVIALLHDFFRDLKLKDVRKELGAPCKSRPWVVLNDKGTITSQLEELLEPFPILEYLLIYLLYGGEGQYISHVVWPFFKTLTLHAKREKSDKLTFPGLLLLTIKTDTELNYDQLTTRLFSFALLMRVALEPFSDVEFYRKIEGARIQTMTRLDERTHAFMATSHELKKLVGLIPLCHDKPFLLQALRDYLLTISLPAAGALNESFDGQLLSKAVTGYTKSGNVCSTYQQWLREIIELACEIHIVALLARQQVIETKEQMDSWIQELTSDVILSPQLAHFNIPDKFYIRCYLAVAILCAIRNVLHHCSVPDVIRISGKKPEVAWDRKAKNSIEVEVETDRGFNVLVIRNPSDNQAVPDSQSGTLLAMDFFLMQIDPNCKGSNVIENGKYVCRLPIYLPGAK